ncbi:MAG: alpha/beta fold hydrolase [Lachnospiraceae bacterium]|nr:alpha/beta fold hydrolase [Lachnospiraceae bacterium]
MHKYFDINEEGFSVRCKLYCDDPRGIRRVIVFGHGFGGHMDNKAAERFAVKALAKYRHLGIVTFNWPCHGSDARNKLVLADCDTYLRLVNTYCREQLGAETLYAYATSFGAYIFLKYMHEHGTPFKRTVLRCPAIPLYEVFTHSIIGKEELEKLAKGKPVLAGFDRKVRITQDLLEEIREADVTQWDFLDLSEDILIQHGTKDEIVPAEGIRRFADDNLIELEEIEGADHRFQDPKKMDYAISEILKFLDL